MASEPNSAQKKISESLDGFYVVDAGPGTGKTFTIVNRYVNIVSKPDIQTKDILLLTFTRNAAAEMEERIREKLTEIKLEKDTRLVQAGTFDSFCYSIVKESPEVISDFLKFDERLTRGATLIENETLNREYFSDFFDRFSAERGKEYGNVAIVASTIPSDIYKLISKLMSKGIVPLKKGWFGDKDGKDLFGNTAKIMSLLEKMNGDPKTRKGSVDKLQNKIKDGALYTEGLPTLDKDIEFSLDVLKASVYDDRSEVLEFIHDVYYDFIRHSVADDRLTFGLNSVFAFLILFKNAGVRERMSCRYVMIDEFQDTNENQMMIALMLLREPNLCVVGDWKQGIYGFRFASIENIIDFEKRAIVMHDYLNDDNDRVPFKIPNVKRLSLDINYRSSQKIIDTSFCVLKLPGTETENVYLNPETVIELTAGNDKIGDNTHVKYVQVPSSDGASETVSRIIDYVIGDYMICDGDVLRKPDYGDIAVICKNGKMCRAVYENATQRGVPAFLQGEVEIMSTREGKLLLSWLKYLNNKRDPWGLVGILSDMEYLMGDIKRIIKPDKDGNFAEAPSDILIIRKELIKKKRRITELISSIFTYYGLNNDVTQAIITTLSSAHRSSLLTISDLIRIIEADIKEHNTYNIDADLDTDAVLIQTMHKSKGLEYPIVIIPQLNRGVIPNSMSDLAAISYNEIEGVRCTEEIVSVDGFIKIGRSWKTDLIRSVLDKDYSEDRRTLFVAISRAKQYVTMICGNAPSRFIDGLSGKEYLGSVGNLAAPLRKSYEHVIDKPEITPFKPRREIIGVHGIMTFEGGTPGEGSDEIPGKGMEYGTKIHAIAEGLARGIEPREDERDLPEISAIREILDSLKDADLTLVEVPCSLPLNDINVTLRGIIDLLALYPDHAVVHDYKTDVSKNNMDAYILQLSVYANAVSGYYKRPVKCVINFISLGEKEEFEPMSIKDIESYIQAI